MIDITNKVREIVAEKLGLELKEVTEESSFIEELGADSLDAVEIVMELEDEFGIQIFEEYSSGTGILSSVYDASEASLLAFFF